MTLTCLVSAAEAAADRREADQARAELNASRFLRNLFTSSVMAGDGNEKLPAYGYASYSIRDEIADVSGDAAKDALLRACKAALHGDEGVGNLLKAFVREQSIRWADDRVEGVL